MTDWAAFAGFSGVVVVLLLLLARLSATMVSSDASDTDADPAGSTDRGPAERDARPSAAVDSPASRGATAESTTARDTAAGRDAATGQDAATRQDAASGRDVATTTDPTAAVEPSPSVDPTTDDLRQFGSGELLANVLVTHGLFAGLIAAGAVYWEVPAAALGATAPTVGTVGWGVAAGLALYVANEVGAALADRLGIDHEETLRELLAPESRTGWALLLGGALPVVAVGEELIFRGVLVGALATGFELPVWGLAVASSAAFALGHGAQGTGGIVVTGLLGFALAAAFVLSGSLLLVIVAHYVVNALEFVVHEGLGIDWAG